MAKSATELVRGLKTQKESKDHSFKQTEWPDCYFHNCPLQATIKADNTTCSYHFRAQGDYANCVTQAINEFNPQLKKYGEMIYWDVKTWQKRAPQIMGWTVLPATKDEISLPTLYLTRFKAWIDKSIKDRADEIFNAF